MSTDLGIIDLLGAEAVGQPGQRRFRLFARSERGSAIMWLEKEQLNNLALVIDRLLAQVTEGRLLRTEARAGQAEKPEGLPGDFGLPSEDFQVAQLKLSYDDQREMLLLIAIPLEIVMEPGQEIQGRVREDLALTLLFSYEQAHELTGRITRVISGGGRPICPLCRQPLDGGPHSCEKQNGHRTIVQIIEEEDEE